MDNETGAFRYQDLIEGVSLGHIDTVITPSDIELWKSAHPKESADAVSQDEDGVAPCSMILALGLRGIMTLKILPPGGVLVGHRLRFHTALPTHQSINVEVRVARRWESRGRPFLTLRIVLTAASRPIADDEMTLIWPTGTAATQVLPQVDHGFAASDPDVHTLRQDQVAVYARLSEDRNPLHLDPAAAASGPFGELIVHGVVPAGVMVEQWAQAAAPSLDWPRTVDLRFLSPLRPDERFRIRKDSDSERPRLICEAGIREIAILQDVSDVPA